MHKKDDVEKSISFLEKTIAKAKSEQDAYADGLVINCNNFVWLCDKAIEKVSESGQDTLTAPELLFLYANALEAQAALLRGYVEKWGAEQTNVH